MGAMNPRILSLVPLIVGGLLIATHLPAQILYSSPQNVEIGASYEFPEYLRFKTAPNTFKIDFNLDGKPDVTLFRSTDYNGSHIFIGGLNGGVFSFFPGVHIHNPDPDHGEFLSTPYWAGDRIDSTTHWEGSDFPFFLNSGSPTIPHPASTGFFDSTGGYIGVRFTAMDGTHFGWIQYAADATGVSGIVYDWAWETTPNAAIIAGDTGLPAVPEPSTYTLFGMAALGLVAAYQRRRRSAAFHQQKQTS